MSVKDYERTARECISRIAPRIPVHDTLVAAFDWITEDHPLSLFHAGRLLGECEKEVRCIPSLDLRRRAVRAWTAVFDFASVHGMQRGTAAE